MAYDPPNLAASAVLFGACRTVTTNQTLTATDGYIRVPSGNAAITLTMYATPASGQGVLIDNLSNNAVTFVPNTGQSLVQANSNSVTSQQQVGGGVRLLWLYSATDKIWKAG